MKKEAITVVETYYDSNKEYLKSKIGFSKHLKEGDYLRFHKNGNTLESGFYKKGKREGLFKTFYEDGTLKNSTNYKQSVVEGLVNSYHENGNLKQEQLYEGGSPSLDFVTNNYYENSKLMTSQKMLSRYESDVKYFDNAGNEINKSKTVFKTFHSNGILKSETNFLDTGVFGHKLLTSGIKQGSYRSFYSDGSQNVSCTYKDNELEGTFKKRFDNGKIEIEAEYSKNEAVSYKEYRRNKGTLRVLDRDKETQIETEESFYADGSSKSKTTSNKENDFLKSKFFFKEGGIEKEIQIENNIETIKIYFNNGILQSIEETSFGDGEYKEFDEIGDLVLEYEISKGKKSGTENTYKDLDKVKTTEYKDGLKDGKETRFYESGSIMSKSTYKEGKQSGDFVHFYENGDIKLTSEFKEGIRDGCQTEFYPSGNLKSKGCYIQDKCDGIYESYHPNGEKKFFINYKNDLEEGLSEGWDKNGEKNYSQDWSKGKVQSKKNH